MSLIYINNNEKLRVLNDTQNGLIRYEDGNLIKDTMTANVYTVDSSVKVLSKGEYHILKYNDSYNLPAGKYILFVNICLINNDIEFMDKYDTLDEYLESPYKISLYSTDLIHLKDYLLIDTCSNVFRVSDTIYYESTGSDLRLKTNFGSFKLNNNDDITVIAMKLIN